jgi:hypothetical protein
MYDRRIEPPRGKAIFVKGVERIRFESSSSQPGSSGAAAHPAPSEYDFNLLK